MPADEARRMRLAGRRKKMASRIAMSLLPVIESLRLLIVEGAPFGLWQSPKT